MVIALDHRRGTVLIVDDEFLLREFAAEVLRSEGYEVLEASNASEAIDILRMRADIDTLFTDVNMPGPIDGLELARRVRQDRPEIRVIVTSGRVRLGAEDLPEEGVFVPKPYLPEAIARTISDWNA